jgi:hypothetical protein
MPLSNSPFEKGGFRGIFKMALVYQIPPGPPFQRGERLSVPFFIKGGQDFGSSFSKKDLWGVTYYKICPEYDLSVVVCLHRHAIYKNNRLLTNGFIMQKSANDIKVAAL